ncbi:MAG: DinB family protein [Acidobacteria bacterium]|nr:DinB family protein [Acidobacteriota bacterium]
MKHRAKTFLLLGTIVLVASQVATAADPVQEQLQKQWEATRNQITTIAQAVPEDKYDYKPTPEVRSFRELLLHIVGEQYTFMGFVAGEKNDNSRFASMKTRAEFLKALSESYDYGAKVLAGMTDQKLLETVPFMGGQQAARLFVVISNLKDNHEHYGNLVTYLRLNGIVPPRTAARQQQQQQQQQQQR